MTRYRFTQRDLRPPTEHRLVTRGAQAPSRSRRALSLVLGAALALPVANSPVLLAQSASVGSPSNTAQQPTEQGHDLHTMDGATAESQLGASPTPQAAAPQGSEANHMAAEENPEKA